MDQGSLGREGSDTVGIKLAHVFRVLDTENRLLKRADQKAISLLSALGVFMVFFILSPRDPD